MFQRRSRHREVQRAAVVAVGQQPVDQAAHERIASADPVALDLACAEAVNRQPVMPNCAITDLQLEHDCDRFHAAHDNTHWQDMIEHGKKLGLGSDEYEIVNIH